MIQSIIFIVLITLLWAAAMWGLLWLADQMRR
jgi:hypothetical protein